MLALEEATLNAHEHGNLELESAWKEQLSEDQTVTLFAKIKQDRLQDNNFSQRKLQIELNINQSEIQISIEDSGEGFDTELYLTRGVNGDPVAVARERHQAGRVGGLGIMLMLKCLDNLEYNYAGNMVKLTKKIG